MLSKRFGFNIDANRLSLLLKKKKSTGSRILDLTMSNPTDAGLNYDSIGILNSIAKPESLYYLPEPKGLASARESVSRYYLEKNVRVKVDDIFLTSGTSEAYSFIFKLLTDPFDEIFIPRPSYPLFSFIAGMESVHLKYYDIVYTKNKIWEIDFDSISKQLTKKTKAIILVNPNNPTGNFVKIKEINSLSRICEMNTIALICDEVFLDYGLDVEPINIFSLAGINTHLTFILSGISKICGLPQMKLSWIVVSGPGEICKEAKEKLEIITDTYLSVGTPVQLAIGDLLSGRYLIHKQIKNRITKNYDILKSVTVNSNLMDLFKTEGGWYSVVKVNKNIDEETMAYDLLNLKDVYIHPGYFFDFTCEGYIVLSLLTPAEIFEEGIKRILEYLAD